MREIMREFSGIALAAISFFLCMVVLSNIRMSDGTTGVFNIIGKAAQTEEYKSPDTDSGGSYERIWGSEQSRLSSARKIP